MSYLLTIARVICTYVPRVKVYRVALFLHDFGHSTRLLCIITYRRLRLSNSGGLRARSPQRFRSLGPRWYARRACCRFGLQQVEAAIHDFDAVERLPQGSSVSKAGRSLIGVAARKEFSVMRKTTRASQRLRQGAALSDTRHHVLPPPEASTGSRTRTLAGRGRTNMEQRPMKAIGRESHPNTITAFCGQKDDFSSKAQL